MGAPNDNSALLDQQPALQLALHFGHEKDNKAIHTLSSRALIGFESSDAGPHWGQLKGLRGGMVWYASTMWERQTACALYRVAGPALRAGHEWDEYAVHKVPLI